MNAFERLLNDLKDPLRSALINGDLVVHSIPKSVKNPIGKYIVYRDTGSQNWYWSIENDKLSAMKIVGSIGGHAVLIESIEFAGGNYNE